MDASGPTIPGQLGGTPTGPPEVTPGDPSLPRRDRRARTHDSRWSGVPLAASLALVAFSVLFGIYGPRIVDRSSTPLGIPAWELGNAAIEYHHARGMGPLHGEGAAQSTTSEAEAALQSLLGTPVRLPGGKDFQWIVHAPRPITLPGSAKGVLVYFSRPSGIGDLREGLSLVLVPDNEQYVVYSPFGRPLLLPPGDVYPIDPTLEIGSGAAALLWSDGTIVRILAAVSPATLDEVAGQFVKLTGEPQSISYSSSPRSQPESSAADQAPGEPGRERR